MGDWIVETKDLKKYYRLGENTVKALDGVNFSVKEQEFTAIVGKSGSGKSTLLHMIGGLDTPTSGSVYVNGKNLAGMTKEKLAIFRRRKVAARDRAEPLFSQCHCLFKSNMSRTARMALSGA